MKNPVFAFAVLIASACCLSSACAAEPPKPAQPAPEATEVWSPVPSRVAPGATLGQAPADAIVLFDGRDASLWESKKDGAPAPWRVVDGALVAVPKTGDIRTKESFSDVQLHLEWMAPVLPADKIGQDRGNSGVFLQGRYEVQILDTLENKTYSNGQAGSIYKQFIPLVNAARPAGEWQTYDILFTAPRFNTAGALISPARMTVLFNGVLIQNNATLTGETVWRGAPVYKAHGPAPISLQEHGHEVRFRNIWVRRL